MNKLIPDVFEGSTIAADIWDSVGLIPPIMVSRGVDGVCDSNILEVSEAKSDTCE